MRTTTCLQFVLPVFLLIKGVGSQWTVWMPKVMSTMKSSCIVIPCNFQYPPSVRPQNGVHGIWYFGDPYPQKYPPVVFKSRTDIVHESYKHRTKLLGDLREKNCTLQISNVGLEHGGKYFFRADLGGSNVYTYPDFSDVRVLDSPIIDEPEEIINEMAVTLSCSAPNNCPDMAPEVNWFNTEGLEEPLVTVKYIDDVDNTMVSSELSFVPSYTHNGKELGCKVHYPNSSLSYGSMIALDVKYPPREVEVNMSLEAMEGSTVVLHCIVDSNPPPLITWYLYDVLVKEEEAQNSTLVLENLQPSQEGIYTCNADNKYGEKNNSLFVAVKYPPREPSVNSSVTIQEGTTITLHCSSEGNPVPTLTWFRDGTLVSSVVSESQSILEIRDITFESDGNYRCLAENEHGRASSHVNVTVQFAPVFLTDSKCTVIREGIQCVCMASGNPEPSVEFTLPDENLTINETEDEFNYYSSTDGYVVTGMIKLKEKPPTGLNVLCTMSNVYGNETIKLELQQEKKITLAVVIGTVGGVAVIAFIIAAVRYIGRNNQKENASGSSAQQPENPPMIYSSVKKEAESLRKKVIRTELLGSKFTSILEEPYMGNDGEYQYPNATSESEQELNYASLQFSSHQCTESSVQTDIVSDYTEIKRK
ncbi:myelin-associated glycoprotein isoform X1 [Polypterus senegalus]|uniref:myelin-associated glycoprotein isoform X1 n=1 Tax=Polypterus senegalus TaxID=55291 RepID=UPI0019640453|nr:myelin-associated glycoprotein isoform X1 [Polypterus senegalus]